VAALSAVTPTNSGTVTAGAAVASSDTIATSVMGSVGVYLLLTNGGGSPDTVTISDAGLTPSGNPLATGSISDTLTNGTSQIYVVRVNQANPATNLVTVTHSFTTSVTYQMWPIGGV
jgi:hypothetical protein